MRNLQKILALVLALIMSFSLVATAGAFSDDGDISEDYKDAVTVLDGLKVFKGYEDGSFQPKGNITRAEVAAIIYRIATGDVTDSQASIYTSYGQFTDVADTAWYSGYVNYCANAGYIKGRGNKIFDPQSSVTGYEALAMILRAVGYDKNGEFTGSNWQIRTASIANEKEITKNVTSAQLGQAATREMVAEILFRSIVIPKVNFNANTLSYTEEPNKDGKVQSLGYESLKLEEITGVVTANEEADLEDTDTLAAGRTRMNVDGSNYTIDYTSTLDDIGEARTAYIQNANVSKVLLLAEANDNKAYESGKKYDKLKDFIDESDKELKTDESTQHFINFDPAERYEAEWRIEYVYKMRDTSRAVAKSLASGDSTRVVNRTTYGRLFEVNADGTRGAEITSLAVTDADRTTVGTFEYVKAIPASTALSTTDQSCIRAIFRHADYELGTGYIDGEVYVGTSSIQKQDDISDDVSYAEFLKTYVNVIENSKAIDSNGRGNKLKIVDYNDDGIVDYVLQTIYTVTTITNVDKDGKYTLETINDSAAADCHNFVDSDIDVLNVGSEDLVKDDVVIYAVIDGNARTEKAEKLNAKIDKVNRTDAEVTTTDGTTYEDSALHVHAEDYSGELTRMAGNTNYNLYLDKYGYLAAFNEASEAFVLLADGWYNSTKGGAEYAVKAWIDGKLQTVDVTANGDLFINSAGLNNDWGQIRTLGGADNKALNADLADRRETSDDINTAVAMLSSDGVLTPVDMAYRTLKQTAMIAMEGDKLPDRDGEWGRVYNTVSNAANRTAYNTYAPNPNRADGTYDVRALSSTVYYFVYKAYSGASAISTIVKEYVGYQNLPENLSYEGHIEDVYVAGTAQVAADRVNYYTADVVVVELDNTYYNTLGGEQVFIPRFPVAGTNVTLEEVELIRENGTLETVTIDMSRSDIRYYDVADRDGTRGMAAGLYRMWESTTQADVYYVRAMNATEIRDSQRYYVGMVEYGTGTNPSNYAVIDTFDTNTLALFPDGTGRASALNVENTKYYTFKGSKLEESTRDIVLAQTPDADKDRRGTHTTADLTQKYDEYAKTGFQRNEVLVAYDIVNRNEEIAYAISFNEYSDYYSHADNDHVHDPAQTVWDKCIPAAAGAPVVPDPVYRTVTVKFVDTDTGAEVAASVVNDKVENGKGVTVAIPAVAGYTVDTVDAGSLNDAKDSLTVSNVTGDITVTVTMKKIDAPVDEPVAVTATVSIFGETHEISLGNRTPVNGVVNMTDAEIITALIQEDNTFKTAEDALRVISITGLNRNASGSWDVPAASAANLQIRMSATGNADVEVPTTRTARPAARAAGGNLVYGFVTVSSPLTKDQIDPEQGHMLGIFKDAAKTTRYTIKEMLDAFSESDPDDPSKTVFSFRAYVNLGEDGKIDCSVNVVKKNDTPQPAGNVHVSIDKYLPTGGTMQLKAADGEWRLESDLPIVDGMVTIQVSLTSTGGNEPYIVGTATGAFTQNNDKSWTAKVPASNGDSIVVSTAAANAGDVTMEQGRNVMILGAGTTGAEKGKRTVPYLGNGGKFDSVSFRVTIPTGNIPQVTIDKAGATASVKQINDTTWDVIVTPTAADNFIGTITCTPSTAPQVTVTKDDSRIEIVEAPPTAPNGSYTLKVKAATGFQPSVTGANVTGVSAGAEENGKVEWTVTLNGIQSNVTLTVALVQAQSMPIIRSVYKVAKPGWNKTSEKIAFGTSYAGVLGNVKLEKESNGRTYKAEFIVSVSGTDELMSEKYHEDHNTDVNGGNLDVKITPVGYEMRQDDASNKTGRWGKWKFVVTGLNDAAFTKGFAVVRRGDNTGDNQFYGQIKTISRKDSSIIIENGEYDYAFSILTDTNGTKVSFKVKTDGTVIPDVRVVANTTTNGEITGKKIEKTSVENEWLITLDIDTVNEYATNLEAMPIEVVPMLMPQINLVDNGKEITVDGNNPKYAVVERDASGTEWFTATFNYTKPTGAGYSTKVSKANGNNPRAAGVTYSGVSFNDLQITSGADVVVSDREDKGTVTVRAKIMQGVAFGNIIANLDGLGEQYIATTDGTNTPWLDVLPKGGKCTDGTACAPIQITAYVDSYIGYDVELLRAENGEFQVLNGDYTTVSNKDGVAVFTIWMNNEWEILDDDSYEVSSRHNEQNRTEVTIKVTDIDEPTQVRLKFTKHSGVAGLTYVGTAQNVMNANVSRKDGRNHGLFGANDDEFEGKTVADLVDPTKTYNTYTGPLDRGHMTWNILTEIGVEPVVTADCGGKNINDKIKIDFEGVTTRLDRNNLPVKVLKWRVNIDGVTEQMNIDFDISEDVLKTSGQGSHVLNIDKQVYGGLNWAGRYPNDLKAGDRINGAYKVVFDPLTKPAKTDENSAGTDVGRLFQFVVLVKEGYKIDERNSYIDGNPGVTMGKPYVVYEYNNEQWTAVEPGYKAVAIAVESDELIENLPNGCELVLAVVQE